MLKNIEPPDVADDREEFERRLKELICWTNVYSVQEATEALLEGDAVKLAAINAEKARCSGQVNGYLQRWDNAANRQEREIICGEPQRNRKK